MAAINPVYLSAAGLAMTALTHLEGGTVSQQIEEWQWRMDQNYLAQFEDIDGEVQPPTPTVILQDSGIGQPLIVSKVIHSSTVEDYFSTSESGTALVVCTQGMSNSEIASITKAGQWAKHKILQPIKLDCTYLDNCRAVRYTYQCSGVRHCEYLLPEIRDLQIRYVDDVIIKLISMAQNGIDIGEDNAPKREANSRYLAMTKLFNSKKACLPQTETCRLDYGDYTENIAGHTGCYARCSNWTLHAKHHFYQSLSAYSTIDIGHFKWLVNHGLSTEVEHCGVVEAINSKRPHCGIDHRQGPGILVNQGCKVRIVYIIPEDLQQTPHIIIVSMGIHEHPIPPPNIPPQELLNEVQSIITRSNDPGLRLIPLLKSPALQELVKRHGKTHISELHESFVNMDRFRRMIEKQRLLYWPEGRNLQGVIFEWNQHHRTSQKPYIQSIVCEDDKWWIVCFYQTQANILQFERTLELDASFKRVKDSNVVELVFAAFIRAHGKICTLARIFMSEETRGSYLRAFQIFFPLVEASTGAPNRWNTIHGSGWYAISSDMDTKQYPALGEYIASLDPHQRGSTYHLERLLVFCRVHFKRGVIRALGSGQIDKGPFSAYQRMMALLDCQTIQDYDQIASAMVQNEPSESVRAWAQHKRAYIVRAGICRAASKMEDEIWMEVRGHTNAVEQSHNKSYAYGIQRPILDAVLSAASMDKLDTEQYLARQLYGTHHSYRTDSASQRYFQNLSRDLAKQRKRAAEEGQEVAQQQTFSFSANDPIPSIESSIQTPQTTSEAQISDPLGILHRVSSSGSPLRRRNSRSTSQSSTSSRGSSRRRSASPRGSRAIPLRQQISNRNLQQQSIQNTDLDRRRQVLELERIELENEEKKIALEERKLALQRTKREEGL